MSESNEKSTRPTVTAAKPTLAASPQVFAATVTQTGYEASPPREPERPWAAGTVLAGRYEIISLLGEGGMGAVYRADDRKLQHPVALKFLSRRVAESPERLRGLYDEVRIGRQISHPNVCRIYDIVETTVGEGTPEQRRVAFLCMEVVEGENLESLLRRTGGLKGQNAIEIAQQVCQGLAAVHDQDLLHRDLKPANIMIDARGVVRLMDFGVSALARDVEPGQIVGTPGYLFPEALEGKAITVRSEIYALGLVLYEIFTGKPLLAARTVNEQIAELKTLDLSRVSAAMDQVDSSARRAVLQCLRADPAQRPATARDVSALLAEGANRRMRFRTLLLGLLMTIIILGGQVAGWTSGLEHALYDWRSRHFRFFAGKPTDQLIHCEIDDAALEEIGRWPWPRWQMARIVDEVNRAGAKAIGLDVLFSEPEAPRPEQQPDGSWKVIDDDALLAGAMRRAGDVMIPVNIPPRADSSSLNIQNDLVEKLRSNLEQPPDSAEQLDGQYPFALRQAMTERLDRELQTLPPGQSPTIEEMRKRLLPQSYSTGIRTYADDQLEKVLPQILAMHELERFTLTRGASLPTPLTGQVQAATAPELAQAARYCGCVTYLPSSDGVVRSVPMLVQYHDRLTPQFGLALACAFLGVDIHSLRIEPDGIILPRAGESDEIIPTYTQEIESRGPAAFFFAIPFFGTSDWRTSYDFPDYRVVRQHLPITRVWDVCQVQLRIEQNNRRAYADVEFVLRHVDLDLLKTFQNAAPAFDNVSQWNTIMAHAFNAVDSGDRDYLLNPNSPLQTDEERDYATALRNLQLRRTFNDSLVGEQKRLRDGLRGLLAEKAVLIGSIASSQGDLWRTPLHAACPGEVILGTVFNAIVTNHFLRVAPEWTNLFATLVLSLGATAAVTWLSPRKSLAACAVLAAGFCVFNALLLFDWDHLVLEMAGPLLAVIGVWLVAILNRVLAGTGRRREQPSALSPAI
jgi:serine/threonine protein kinase